MSIDEDSETLSERRSAPLIARPPHSDLFVKVALMAVVSLLTFLVGFAYNGNREIGELTSEFRESTKATDRRITASEAAADRRMTALETRVERIEDRGK